MELPLEISGAIHLPILRGAEHEALAPFSLRWNQAMRPKLPKLNVAENSHC